MVRLTSFVKGAALCATLIATLTLASPASADYSVVYNFTGGNDGGNPATDLVFDASGNAYGTTVVGGTFGCGTVFEVTPVQGGTGTESVLFSFDCYSTGKNPHGGVTFGPGNNLFGTTVAGGAGLCAGDGCGVVFEVAGPSAETVIHDFSDTGGDGWGPGSRVVFDQLGNMYGTTPDGGKYGVGTVYELTQSGKTWTERVIHNFTGRNDGGTGSLGPLLVDKNGNLWGVTETGGKHGFGTVYEMTPNGNRWTFKTIYQFKGPPDAGSPYGGLIGDPNGNLFGTTYYGGRGVCGSGGVGCGTAYELSPNGRGGYREHVIHSFRGGKDGSFPTSTLLLQSNGDLYGTTSMGGFPPCDCGTVFQFASGTWKETILHRFHGNNDGGYPYYGLAPYGGNLYGTAVTGGHYGAGVVFEVTLPSQQRRGGPQMPSGNMLRRPTLP